SANGGRPSPASSGLPLAVQIALITAPARRARRYGSGPLRPPWRRRSFRPRCARSSRRARSPPEPLPPSRPPERSRSSLLAGSRRRTPRRDRTRVVLSHGRTPSDTLRLDARTLRFHLGTSLADLRVPVHVDESVRAVLRSAVRDLFFLLALRHRSTLRESEYDSLILLDGFDPRAARQTSF